MDIHKHAKVFTFAEKFGLHKHVLSYCTSVGYAVVIGQSKKTVSGLKKGAICL